MTAAVHQEKPSILFLGSQMATGGAQHLLLEQARWFHQRGHRVVAAYFYDKEGHYEVWREQAPYPLINLNGWRKEKSLVNGLRLTRALIQLYFFLKKEKFTVVETFTHSANILGLPLAWAAKIPVRIASHHGRFEGLTSLQERFHRVIINSGLATRMVAVSSCVAELATEKEHINPNKITVIRNGIDMSVEVNLDEEERISLRQSLGVGTKDFLIITVGRLVNQKGHVYLLEAMAEVIKHFPHTKLVIAGNGPLQATLVAKARTLQIEKSVHFAGNRGDVPYLLSIGDCFVLSSLWEGLPIALLEAMRAGLAIIATKVEGITEVITDGINGLLVPAADARALAQSIMRIISDDVARERIGRQGRTEVMRTYSYERMCEEYATLFQRELEARG